MPRIPHTLRAYARDAAGAFRQSPLEVLLGLLAAATFSAALRGDDFEEWWLRVAAFVALSFPLVLGLTVLRARGVVGEGARWAASAAVLAAAGGYAAWGFDPDRTAELWRFLALLGAAVLALSLVPAVGVADGGRRRLLLWRFNFRLLARVVTVVAYGLALYAALAGAVGAVSALFELDTPEELYGDLFGVVFFALVPWVVAGGVPELVEEPAEGERLPRGVRLLGRYLYFPVLVIYLAILLAYTIKVGVTGEVPQNLLSPIVLLAGLFGFLGGLLLEPLVRHPEHAGVARLIRLFPVLLLPLLPLAVWAVWVRQEQYGWTEFRYLRLLLLGVLLVLAVWGTWRLLRRRRPLLTAIPAVLGAALLLAAVGPWSAPAVSRRDQEARLREGLRAAGLLEDGRLSRPLPAAGEDPRDTLLVPSEVYDRIEGSLTYLYDAHGPGALRGLVPGDPGRFGSGWSLVSALGLRAGCAEEVGWAHATLPSSAPVPGIPAGTLHQVTLLAGARGADTTGALAVRLDGTGVAAVGGEGAARWTARADLGPLVASVLRSAPGECERVGRTVIAELSPADATIPLVDGAGEERGRMIVEEVRLDRGRESTPRTRGTGGLVLRHVSGMVVVRE